MTENQRLATPGRHQLHPQRLVRSSLPFQIPQRANVVHLDPVPAATQLTRLREESLHELRRVDEPIRNEAIVKTCVDLPRERNATPLRYQRRLAFAFHPHLEDGPARAILHRHTAST